MGFGALKFFDLEFLLLEPGPEEVDALWDIDDSVRHCVALAEPLLRPFRRLVPAVGGFDVSPIFAIVILKAAEIVLQSYRPIPI